NSPGGSTFKPQELRTSRELVEALDGNVAQARKALANTTDEHLMKPWRFLVGGRVVNELPRHIMLRDGVFNHLAHHRGQLTAYHREAAGGSTGTLRSRSASGPV